MRRVVAVLLMLCAAGFACGLAWAQTPAPADASGGNAYIPPMRGAPEGRTGGASRDIGPVQNPGNLPAARDAALWQSIRDSNDPADFAAFLMRYPNSDFAALAERRLIALRAQPAK